jgi:hypothetical protein
MGGYNGESMVPTVEIYDPRLDAWRMDDPMHTPRGYAAAVNLDDSLLLIGGMQSNVQLLDTVSNHALISDKVLYLLYKSLCSVLKDDPFVLLYRWKSTMQAPAGQSLDSVRLGRGPSHLPLSCSYYFGV